VIYSQKLKDAELHSVDINIAKENNGFTHILIDNKNDVTLRLKPIEAKAVRMLKSGINIHKVITALSQETGKYQYKRIIHLEKVLEKSYQQASKAKFYDIKIESKMLANAINIVLDSLTSLVKKKSISLLFLFFLTFILLNIFRYQQAIQSLWSIDQLGIVSTVFIIFISLFLHELGHAAALNLFGIKLKEAGLYLYFGIPMMYVETGDAQMLSRVKRMIVYSAGPIVNLLLFLSTIGLLTLIPGQLLLDIAKVNLFMLIYSLFPFINSDGKNIYQLLFNLNSLRENNLPTNMYRVMHLPSIVILFGYSIYFWTTMFGL
jgi:Zn-dependent protease